MPRTTGDLVFLPGDGRRYAMGLRGMGGGAMFDLPRVGMLVDSSELPGQRHLLLAVERLFTKEQHAMPSSNALM